MVAVVAFRWRHVTSQAIMPNFRTHSDPAQQRLLGYSIDDLVPQDHPVRRFIALVRRLDFTALRLRYAGRGKPAFPPEAMFGLFVWILERFGPVSLRRMQELASTDMTCRFAAAGFVPDHVTLSDFITRCGELFAALHAGLLKVLFEEGLLTGKTPVLDGSKMPSARAGRSSVLRPGIVFERLDKLAKQLQELYGRLVASDVDTSPAPELPGGEEDLDRLAKKVRDTVRAVEQLRAATVSTVETAVSPAGEVQPDEGQAKLFPVPESASSESAPGADSPEKASRQEETAAVQDQPQRSKLADQVKSLLADIQQGQDVLNSEFRQMPRQLHPGDPEMAFVKTAQEGIRPGANLQVLSMEDGFIQVIELLDSPTDQDVLDAVLRAASEQRPAAAAPLTEIVTDGGYATCANADACATAGVVLRTPSRSDTSEPTGDSKLQEPTVAQAGDAASVLRHLRTSSDLEREILTALNAGPQRRVHLRRALGIQNARLGDLLEGLEKAGRIHRTAAGWCRTESSGSAPRLEESAVTPPPSDDSVSTSPESTSTTTASSSSPTVATSAHESMASDATSSKGDLPDSAGGLTVGEAAATDQGEAPPVAVPPADPVRIPLRQRGATGTEPRSTPKVDVSQRILSALAESSVPMSRQALRRIVGINNQRLGMRLLALQQRDLIHRAGRAGWVLSGKSAAPEAASSSEPTTSSEADLYFQWDSALETFLCPIGRPMSPRLPDNESSPSTETGRGHQPIPGTYIATGCQTCPLAKTCLSASQLQKGTAKRLTVGREALRQGPSPYRLPVGHPAWKESTPLQRRLRAQHAEGRFLVLKHLRHLKRLPYRGVPRNRKLVLLVGISANVRRAIDLRTRKADHNEEDKRQAA